MQALSPNQRKSLTSYITNARENCGVWIAERLEALSHQDLLSEGALQERDYERYIQLEQQWSGARRKTFAKFVEQIANLRAAKAEGFEDREFFPVIADREDAATWNSVYEDACAKIRDRITTRVGDDVGRYENWMQAADTFSGDPWERALNWRVTEVLVETDLNRHQTSFSFDQLTEQDFRKRANRVTPAAEHFLCTEVRAPIYFGRDTLALVSTCNIDQYLEVAGELFEEVTAKIRGRRDMPSPLSAKRQDILIRRVAKQRWDGMIRRLPHGAAAKQLLMGFQAFARKQTFRPTAPYPPGVTGFGITMSDRRTLIDSNDDEIRHFVKLHDVLTSLVAHNLLVPNVDYQNKGKSLVVFYLNRLLCVQFDLPLGRGGWREKTLKELNEWMEHGASGESSTEEDALV